MPPSVLDFDYIAVKKTGHLYPPGVNSLTEKADVK